MSQDYSKQAVETGEPKWSRFRVIARVAAILAWVMFSFLAAQIAVTWALRGLVAAGVPLSAMNDSVLLSVVTAVIYSLAIAVAIGLPWWLRKVKTSPAELGLHRLPSWMDILLAPAGYVVYMIISVLLMSIAVGLVPGFDVSQEQNVGFNNLVFNFEYLLAFVALVIIAPVAEEVLFRGYLFGKLRKLLPVWLAILLTSLLFGYVHGAWNVAIDTFALSLMLCVLRISTGSLWAPILLHMLKNAIAFYLLFINPSLVSTLGG